MNLLQKVCPNGPGFAEIFERSTDEFIGYVQQVSNGSWEAWVNTEISDRYVDSQPTHAMAVELVCKAWAGPLNNPWHDPKTDWWIREFDYNPGSYALGPDEIMCLTGSHKVISGTFWNPLLAEIVANYQALKDLNYALH